MRPMPDPKELPPHYVAAIRTAIRYAIVMVVVGLLSGILFQESSKKLDYDRAGPGLRLETIIHLALVHGHVFITGVLIPLAMAGALVLARRVGGADLAPRTPLWFTRGYLTFTAVTVALMLYKGYHVLLAVRGGETDLAAVDQAFFGGWKIVRHLVYGVAHAGMGISLIVFVVGLWRSLETRA